MDLKTAIRNYLNLGYSLCFLKPGTKERDFSLGVVDEHVPATKADERIEQAVIRKCGLGLFMGYRLHDDGLFIFALDFDEPSLYDWWIKNRPELADTPTQQTPNGVHVLLSFPFPIDNAKSDTVDVISRGWYIVAEPSVHPSGQPYKWLIAPWHIRPINVHTVRPNPSAEESIFHFPGVTLTWQVDDYGEEVEGWEHL